jgi:nitrous oxide reductase accessory protein NosL
LTPGVLESHYVKAGGLSNDLATIPDYVVGSKILGPMGHEAIAFDLKSEAVEFAQANGGQILKFPNVTIEKIKAK